MQNSLSRAVVRAPKFSHINHAFKSLHCLKIKQHVDYKILSLTYEVLTTTQTIYIILYVQPHRSTRSLDVITLSRPPSCSSLKVNNRFFRRARAGLAIVPVVPCEGAPDHLLNFYHAVLTFERLNVQCRLKRNYDD